MEKALKVVEKQWEIMEDRPLAQGMYPGEFLAEADHCKPLLSCFQKHILLNNQEQRYRKKPGLINRRSLPEMILLP